MTGFREAKERFDRAAARWSALMRDNDSDDAMGPQDARLHDLVFGLPLEFVFGPVPADVSLAAWGATVILDLADRVLGRLRERREVLGELRAAAADVDRAVQEGEPGLDPAASEKVRVHVEETVAEVLRHIGEIEATWTPWREIALEILGRTAP